MAFQIPALIAWLVDASIIASHLDFYINQYQSLGFNFFIHSFIHQFEWHSVLVSGILLDLLACIRVILILPYLWFYHYNAPMYWSAVPKSWLYLNCFIFLLRMAIIYCNDSNTEGTDTSTSGRGKTDNDGDDDDSLFFLSLSIASCILHFICLNHLKSTAPSDNLSFSFATNREHKSSFSESYNSPVQLNISSKFGKIDQNSLNSLVKPNNNLASEFNDIESHHINYSNNSNNNDKNNDNINNDSSNSNISAEKSPSNPSKVMGTIRDVKRRLSETWSDIQDMDWDLDDAAYTRGFMRKSNKIKSNRKGGKQQPLFNLIIDLFTDRNSHLYESQNISKEKEMRYKEYISHMSERINSEITIDSISEVKFFISQLSIHLLHGQDTNIALALQSSFLSLCRESITVSHRWYWFLNAFYLTENSSSSSSSSDYSFTEETRLAIQDILREISKNGEIAAKNAMEVQRHCYSDEISETDTSPLINNMLVSDSRSPLNVSKKSGAQSNNRLSLSPVTYVYDRVTSHFDVGSEASANVFTDDNDKGGYSKSTHSLSAGVASSPLRVLHENLTDIFPAHMIESKRSSSPVYQINLSFWSTLCEMSKKVALVPKVGRNEYLRVCINEVSKEVFPSPHYYAPLGSDQHRICSIVADESFAFSTKSRAPVFLCLEIIDFGSRMTRKPRSSWWGGITKQLRESLGAIGLPGMRAISRSQSPAMSPSRQAKLGSNLVSPINRSTKLLSGYGSVEDSSSSNKISPLFTKNTLNNNHNNNHDNAIGLSDTQAQENTNKNSLLPGIPLEIDVSATTIPPCINRSPSTKIKSPITALFTPPKPDLARLRTSPLSSLSADHSRNPLSDVSYDLCDSDPGNNSEKEKEKESKTVIVFQEQWKHKEERLRELSPMGHLPGWRLLPVIVKTMDDLRQEQIISQSVAFMHHILIEAEVDCYLRPYDIIALSSDCGLIEAVPNTLSLDALKKSYPEFHSLSDFFSANFSPVEVAPIIAMNLQTEVATTAGTSKNSIYKSDSGFESETEPASFGTSIVQAKENFTKSLATYCIICYILQLKDRHNGNILIDSEGHIIHIDFGFVLGLTPGNNLGFESAPFKLTGEMVDVMGGSKSKLFYLFRDICVKVFMELRRQCHRIILALEIFARCHEHLPCFSHNKQASLEGSQKVISDLRGRFHLDLHDHGAILKVHELIDLSLDNWTTTCYDHFQRSFNGIF